LGGRMVVPSSTDAVGPQADRSLVLWPYTDPGDARLHLTADAVSIDTTATGHRLKIGVAPGRGHASYERNGTVLEKHVAIEAKATYADRGAAIQVFVNDDFCELETLGPLREVAPGDVATHRERWVVRSGALAS
jgi:hypothetical protein